MLVLVYGTLFTKYGNNIVASYIEKTKQIQGKEKVKLKVDDFTLTLNYLNFDAWINDDSKINISGDLSLFRKSVDLKYDIKINDLSTLKNLTNQEFKDHLLQMEFSQEMNKKQLFKVILICKKSNEILL